MKSQTGITMAVISLLVLGAASSLSLMPVHAVTPTTATWNFRETDSLPNTTVTLTYGFEVKNGSITTIYCISSLPAWNGDTPYCPGGGSVIYNHMPTFRIIESLTIVENVSTFTFEANMDINCSSPRVIGFITETYNPPIQSSEGYTFVSTGVAESAACIDNILWAGTSISA